MSLLAYFSFYIYFSHLPLSNVTEVFSFFLMKQCVYQQLESGLLLVFGLHFSPAVSNLETNSVHQTFLLWFLGFMVSLKISSPQHVLKSTDFKIQISEF